MQQPTRARTGPGPAARRTAKARRGAAPPATSGLLAAVTALVATTAAGCGAPPPTVEDPRTALDRAEGLLVEGRPTVARRLLRALPDEALDAEDDARRRLLLARALHAEGRSWRAFRVIEDFADRDRFSVWLPAVQDLELDIGRTLIRSDGGWLLVGYDADEGARILRHFRRRFPNHRGGAEALRLLGEQAFAREEYDLAAERYRQLISEYPLSEWEPLASFRLAMCRFLVLQGPEYDERAMRDARAELGGFLDQRGPDRPEFRTQAQAALDTVEAWLAERQLLVADYYRTIEQPTGELVFLRRVLQEFPESPQAELARPRLLEVERRLREVRAAEGPEETP